MAGLGYSIKIHFFYDFPIMMDLEEWGGGRRRVSKRGIELCVLQDLIQKSGNKTG